MIIHILSVEHKDDFSDWYFSTNDKAIAFINKNFASDAPRKVTNDYYEGKYYQYFIHSRKVDQETFTH